MSTLKIHVSLALQPVFVTTLDTAKNKLIAIHWSNKDVSSLFLLSELPAS